MKFFECHGHIMLDGADFQAAIARHKNGADKEAVRKALDTLAASGVVYFRDGGDSLGVTAYARTIAEEYGIRYATPAFATCKEGRYGKMLGRTFDSMADFRALVDQARKSGADYIKLMMSGIMTFAADGELSCPPLSDAEISECVRIAHGEGFRMMAHVNGSDTIKAALEAGTDSIEHGYFMDEEGVRLLVETKAVWVPTLSPLAAVAGLGGEKGRVAGEILENQLRSVGAAIAQGAYVASGSDSGAFGVPHTTGIAMECGLMGQAARGIDEEQFGRQLLAANERVRDLFVVGSVG